MSYTITHSQNYLHDSSLVGQLLQQSSITPEDLVLEIGPGKGIITTILAERCKHVDAVEKDQSLYLQLKKQFEGNSKVVIHQADFLDYKLPQKDPYKIFSNIPFTITANIVRKILNAPNPSADSYLILQQEAAGKFAGQPYHSENLTSLLYKPWFNFTNLHTFKPTDFEPVPKVTPVLMRIEKRVVPLVSADQAVLYKDFIAYGFVRNKSNLKKDYEHIFSHVQFLRLAHDLHFNIEAKPTDLTFEQWLGLFNYFVVGVGENRQKTVIGALDDLHDSQKDLEKIHRSRKF